MPCLCYQTWLYTAYPALFTSRCQNLLAMRQPMNMYANVYETSLFLVATSGYHYIYMCVYEYSNQHPYL